MFRSAASHAHRRKEIDARDLHLRRAPEDLDLDVELLAAITNDDRAEPLNGPPEIILWVPSSLSIA